MSNNFKCDKCKKSDYIISNNILSCYWCNNDAPKFHVQSISLSDLGGNISCNFEITPIKDLQSLKVE